ncbi:hypothetical protein [Brevibacillus sp. H7]|uniref:hypothetical protein n=1 Tax=Brevibacillus sp. H7 TaxID=3349138 RepID=UPI003819A615
MVRAKNRKRISWLMLTVIAGVVFGYVSWLMPTMARVETAQSAEGYQLKFRTKGEELQIYEDGQWKSYFVKGINLGASLPGYYPGEFPIQKEDYLRWFAQISELGVKAVRIYTIHQPVFYEALVEYNRDRPDDPLYLIQGIWSPEEALNEKLDAYLPEIRQEFRQEIEHAVGAVYGDISIPEKPGKAYGKYTVNAGPYLLGWHIGTEWNPEMVKQTNRLRQKVPPYDSKHIQVEKNASSFEKWLAEMMDYTAQLEAERGWQHPIAFTNWVTTDPIKHPGEPIIHEDMVSVDPTHIKAVQWEAGTFAAYHVYPYYPDFFRLDATLKTVKNRDGEIDTYKAYLRELKKYHAGMPIMVTEFGVPSSLGVAHLGHLGRDQGGHREQEQGRINAELLREIADEGYSGAVLFEWQDEWFKRTWNTMRYEIPEERRSAWMNVLTNESFFGLLAMHSSKEDDIIIDGNSSDWHKISPKEKQRISVKVPGFEEIWVTHDEGYLYLGARLDKPFIPEREKLMFGVDTIPGGNRQTKELPGLTLDEGLEALVILGNRQESEVKIASNYDFHRRLYGIRYGMLPVHENEMKDNSGLFVPWKLAVSLKMEPPDTKQSHPFEEVVAGRLYRGNTEPGHPEYNSHAHWQTDGKWVELRIPWMLLGFTDPSTRHVMSYSGETNKFHSIQTNGIRMIPMRVDKQSGRMEGVETGKLIPFSTWQRYSWPEWSQPGYVERIKQSYHTYQKALQSIPTYR